MQRLQALAQQLETAAGIERFERFIHAHAHELRQAVFSRAVERTSDCIGLLAVARPVAIGAIHLHVGQELHVKRNLAGAVACGAPQLPGVV